MRRSGSSPLARSCARDAGRAIFAIDARAARPCGRSSAAWSGGRASWPRGCRRCGRTATPCSRRRARSRTAPATRGSRPCCRSARAAPAPTRCCARPTSRRCAARARRRAPRRGRAAPPELVLGRLRRWQRRLLPRVARARAARDHGVGVLRAPSCASCSACRSSASASCRAASTRRSRPDADAGAGRARRARPRAAVRALRRLAHGAQEPRRARAAGAARSRREGVDVVVAGGHRPQFAAEAGLGALRLLGHVPDAAAARPLRRRRGVRAARRVYEGFGLPVLEAMAAGTPVVAADTAALPETCGGAATARGARRRGDRARAVTSLLADTAERDRLRAAGLARAAGFRWDRTARRGRRRDARGRTCVTAAQAQRRSAGAFAQPSSLRAQPRKTPSAGDGDHRGAAQPAQAGPVERARPALGREPRVPEHARDPVARAARRRAAPGHRVELARLALIRSISKPTARSTFPLAAGHESSVIQTGSRAGRRSRASRSRA